MGFLDTIYSLLPDNSSKKIKAKDVRSAFEKFDERIVQVENRAAMGYVAELKKDSIAPNTGWEIGLYRLLEIGIYPNLTPSVDVDGSNSPIEGREGKINEAYFDGTTWSKSEVEMPKSNGAIPFEDLTFPATAGTQTIYNGEYYIVKENHSALATDIPSGDSVVWDKIVKIDNSKKNKTSVSFVQNIVSKELYRRNIDTGLVYNFNFPNLVDTISGINPDVVAYKNDAEGLHLTQEVFSQSLKIDTIPVNFKYTFSVGINFSFTELIVNQKILTLLGDDGARFYIAKNADNKLHIAIVKATFTEIILPVDVTIGTEYKLLVVVTAFNIYVWLDGVKYSYRRTSEGNFPTKLKNFKTFVGISENDVEFASIVVKSLTLWDRPLSNERALDYFNGIIDSAPAPLDKFNPIRGLTTMDNVLTNVDNYKHHAEPSIVKFKGKYFLYETWTTDDFYGQPVGIGCSVSSRLDGEFTSVKNGLVVGDGNGGVQRAMGSYAVVSEDGNEVLLFSSRDYAFSPNTYIHKSTDGINFQLVVDSPLPIYQETDNTKFNRWANWSVYPEKQPDGYYYALVERMGLDANGQYTDSSTWEMILFRTTDLKGDSSKWEQLEKVQGLKISPNGMVGGPTLLKSANDKYWMLFYHAGGDELGGTGLPTKGAFAYSTSPTPTNWIQKFNPIMEMTDVNEEHGAVITDQVADTFLIEDNGKCYYFYAVMQNNPSVIGQSRVVIFDGTKEELVNLI